MTTIHADQWKECDRNKLTEHINSTIGIWGGPLALQAVKNSILDLDTTKKINQHKIEITTFEGVEGGRALITQKGKKIRVYFDHSVMGNHINTAKLKLILVFLYGSEDIDCDVAGITTLTHGGNGKILGALIEATK